MNNETVWVVMNHNGCRVECKGVFHSFDRAEEFVVATSSGSLVKSDVSDSLYVCKYRDGIHHMTNERYTIEEQPIR